MLEEFKFPICNYNRKHYLTDNIIGTKNKDTGNIDLLTYDDTLSFVHDIATVKPYQLTRTYWRIWRIIYLYLNTLKSMV